MRGAIPPPQHVSMTWYLVKHSDNFSFYLYIVILRYTRGKDTYIRQYRNLVHYKFILHMLL
jgi:hypothetical protein